MQAPAAAGASSGDGPGNENAQEGSNEGSGRVRSVPCNELVLAVCMPTGQSAGSLETTAFSSHARSTVLQQTHAVYRAVSATAYEHGALSEQA